MLVRAFHNAATCTMAATPSPKQELEAAGLSNVALWPLGVDTDFFAAHCRVLKGL
jgi:hypothetical protein